MGWTASAALGWALAAQCGGWSPGKSGPLRAGSDAGCWLRPWLEPDPGMWLSRGPGLPHHSGWAPEVAF